MAVELATAYVSLVPSFKGAQKAIASELGDSKAVAEAGRRSGLGWVKGASKVLGGAVLAGVGATAGVALTKGFTRAIQLQDAEAKLTGLGHSAENVAKISDNALGAVKGTAFGMGEAMTVAANAVAAGVKPGQELERNLRLVGDAATIAGTDMGSMGAIFNKVAASNKVQMDVINQLHDAGVPALSLLADQMGVTADEASKMASAGQVDFATFQAAMEKGLGGAAQASGQTFTGAMKNVGAALGRVGAMFATPVVTGAPSVFQAITGAVDSLGTVLKPVAEQFGNWLAPAMETVAEWISKIDFAALFSGMSSGEGTLSNVVALFSPLGEVVKAMLPSLGQLGGVVKQVAGAIGGALSAVLPILAEALLAVLDALSGVVPILAGALSNVLPVIASAFTSLVQAVAPLIPVLVQALAPILPIVATAIAAVAEAVAPLVPVLGKALASAVQTILPPLIEVAKAVLPVLASVLGVVLSAVKPIIPALLTVVQAFLPLLPVVGNLISTLLPPLVSLITALAPVVEMVAKVLAAILVPVIKVAGNIIGWLVEKVITPLVQWLSDKIPVAIAAMRVVWDQVWNAVKTTISAVWNWINKWVITPFKLALEALKYTFQVVKDAIGKAWDTMKTGLSTGWDWIKKNVFNPLKDGVNLVGDAFTKVKDGIKTAWDKLKEIAAKPVNFVLGTVYNDGIREWWNKIAGAVGLNSLTLPKASLVKFASGGVLPGYTPGRDVHEFYSPTAGRLSLSGGEAIMRPEFTRAVGGAKGVARLNAMARRGQAFASGGVFGRRPETGGFWDNVGGVASSIGRGLRSFGESLWDAGAMAVEIIKDPIGAIKRAVSQIMENAGPGGNSGGFFDIVGTLPAKFAVGLAEKVKSMLGAQQTDGGGAAGAPAGALGVARMSQIVRSLVPGARVTSGFRPGAITATGFPSMHGMGRAIDIAAARPGDSAGMMAIFNALRAAYPNATELIYSPAGGRQLYKGKPKFYGEPTRGDHWDHVHWAMKNGGVIPGLFDQGGWLPHGGVGVNLTGRPEAVLTPEESAGLKNMRPGQPLDLSDRSIGKLADALLAGAAVGTAGALGARDRALSNSRQTRRPR
jgi:tape measure domain-containing protein